jgi:RNA-splicing ligase RtcB
LYLLHIAAKLYVVFIGGIAKQLDYISVGYNNKMAQTFGSSADFEQAEFVNSRAEAKRAHLERMHHLRMNDERDRNVRFEEAQHKAEEKTAFQIAVAVANASEFKVICWIFPCMTKC